jgi:TolB-like protein
MNLPRPSPRRRFSVLAVAGALTLLFLAGACVTERVPPSVYVHPMADFSVFRKVAVFPLDNLTTDRFAGERVREVLVTEMLAMGAFDLVDVGEVNRILRMQKLDASGVTALGPEKIAALGRELGVQAILLGSVLEYAEKRSGSFTSPEVALSLRLIDVDSGIAVWSVSHARSGLSTMTRLLGMGEETHTETVRELVREILEAVFEVAGW